MTMVLVLLLLGFGLVAAEVFFPSMGALSIMAGLALIGGVIAGFDVSTSVGWWAMTGVIIGLPCVIVFAFRVLRESYLSVGVLICQERLTFPLFAFCEDFTFQN